MSAVQASPDAAAVPRQASHFSGLLPHWMLRWRRPLWWQELALIGFGYWLYSLGRNAIPEQAQIATRHGVSVQKLQDTLHLNFELSFNRFVARTEWLAQLLNYYYATLHFVVTIGVLVWLFVRRSHVYRGARTVLVATTLIGLLGFYLYPLAPPRLLPQFGYIDTLVLYETWGSLASPSVAAHSNQYAAMPSLHIGWSLWAGIALFYCARRTWVRVVGLCYPVATLLVIIGTANHFLIDAVGGATAVGCAFAIQWLLSGRGAFAPPVDAPDFEFSDASTGQLQDTAPLPQVAAAGRCD